MPETSSSAKRVTWVSPSGTALIVDKQGQDKPSDAVLSRLFERTYKVPAASTGRWDLLFMCDERADNLLGLWIKDARAKLG